MRRLFALVLFGVLAVSAVGAGGPDGRPGAPLRRPDGEATDGPSRAPVTTVVVVIDGLEPEVISPALTPNLWRLIRGETGNATVYSRASASMISETIPNHVAMWTGLPGQLHGLVANSLYNRAAGRVQATARPELVLTDTLFDAVERQRPELGTAAVMGKQVLRPLFDCTRRPDGRCGPSGNNPEGRRVTHVRPDFLRGASTDPAAVIRDPDRNAPGEPVSGSGVTADQAVMDQIIDLHRRRRPDLTLVNLGQVDAVQHLFGDASPPALAAVRDADRQIGRLVAALVDTGRWQQSILVVTADHSFAELDGTGDAAGTDEVRVTNPAAGQVTGSRVVLADHFDEPGVAAVVAHGGSASLYLDDPADRRLAARLARRARRLRDRLGRPAVAGAFCRRPGLGCPKIPDRFGLDTARVGEVVLVADDQHAFITRRRSTDAALSGHHGGPTALPVPLIVASGGPSVATRTVSRTVTTRDIAPTVAWIYGIAPRGRQAHGRPFPGRPRWSRRLAEAFVSHPGGSVSHPAATSSDGRSETISQHP